MFAKSDKRRWNPEHDDDDDNHWDDDGDNHDNDCHHSNHDEEDIATQWARSKSPPNLQMPLLEEIFDVASSPTFSSLHGLPKDWNNWHHYNLWHDHMIKEWIVQTLLHLCQRLLVTQWRSFSVDSITVISSSPWETWHNEPHANHNHHYYCHNHHDHQYILVTKNCCQSCSKLAAAVVYCGTIVMTMIIIIIVIITMIIINL